MVVTVLPTHGLVSVVPWICAISASPVGQSPGVGSGFGVGWDSSPVPSGVMSALSVKSALLSFVSTPFVRFSDFTSVLFVGAMAAAFSNVLVSP